MFELVRKPHRGNKAGTTFAPRFNPMAKVSEGIIYFPNHTIKKDYEWCELLVDRGELKLKVVCSLGMESENSYKLSCIKQTTGGSAKHMGAGSRVTQIPVGKYMLISEKDNVYIFQHESKLN